MSILSWIFLGLIAGTLANFLDPRESRGGILGSLILGVLGALLGGFLADLIFGVSLSGFSLTSLIIATLGSMLLLLLQKIYQKEDEQERRENVLSDRDVAYYSQVTPLAGDDNQPIRKVHFEEKYLLEDPKEKQIFLASLDYPISKRDIIRYAEENYAHEKSLSLLEALPDRIYQSVVELEAEIDRLT